MPADSPGAPAQYAKVEGPASGPASFNIQAGQDDLTGVFKAATAAAGPRQAQTEVLLSSPQGFAVGSGTSGYDILGGSSGGGGDDWPSNVQPGA
jgi:hypothetical protein